MNAEDMPAQKIQSTEMTAFEEKTVFSGLINGDGLDQVQT
jgi:hypothetical protein